MPTLEQLPQATAAHPEDRVLLEQNGVASVTSVAALLADTQARLTLAPHVLLGRAGPLPGGPEVVGVGPGLKIEAGALAADTADLAALDSPAFSGRPTAPTRPAQDDSDALATTAFVQQHTAQASPVKAVAGRTGYVTIGAADVAGLSRVATTGAYADLLAAPAPFVLPVASGAVLGGVKAGAGLAVAGDGTASLADPLPGVDAGALTVATAGGVARRLAARAADSINVMDFPGAAADGVATATAAINAAIAVASARPHGGEVWLPAGIYRIDTALAAIRAMSNVVLRGAGRGRTVLLMDDTNGGDATLGSGAGLTNAVAAGTAGAVVSVTGGSFAPIADFELRDLTIKGLRDSLPSNGVHLVNINTATNVVVRNCAFLSSRMFSLLIANSTGVSVQDCHVSRSSRDSIALWDCSDVVVTGNHIAFSGDDSISLHANDASPAPVRSGIMVANNVISDGQGIAVLGPKMVTIANNVIRRAPVHGIFAASNPAFHQGDTSAFALHILNNTIADVFDPSGWIAGSGSKTYIWVGGARRAAGGLPSAPGTPVPGTGVVTPLYGPDGAGAFYANNAPSVSVNGSNAGNPASPSPGNHWVRIEGNTLVRSLPAVAAWSDWGYGSALPVGNGVTYNGPITDAMQQGTGVYVEGPLYNSRIAGNIIQTGARRAIEFSNAGLVDMDYDGLVVEGNHIVDFWEFGVFLPSTTSQRIRFERNVLDGDPYFKSSARGPNGTWRTPGPPIGLYMPYVSGVQIIGNHFRNMYSANSSSTGQQLLKGNVVHCDPVAVGYSSANRGMGNVPAAGPSFSHVIENGDPTDANVGRSKSATLLSAATQPASGTYVIGHFVAASAPAVTNGQVLMGWKRLTTGSSHVPGTDWATVYGAGSGTAALASPAFTGTPTAPTPPLGNASSLIATTGFVAGALAAPGSVGSVTPGVGFFTSLLAGGASPVFAAGGDPNGSIVLGRIGAGSPYIDFVGNGLASGNSARLQSDAAGQLTVSVSVGSVVLNVAGQLRAGTMTLGGANVATQPWVQSQSYVTTAALPGLAPVRAVAGRTGVITLGVGDVSGLGSMATQAASAVAITGGSVAGRSSLVVANATGSGVTEGVNFGLSAPAGKARQWFTQTAGVSRWAVGATSTAETGGNAGSDFAVVRFNDAGAPVDAPLTISRGSGQVLVNALSVAGAPVATQAYVSSRVPAIPTSPLLGGFGGAAVGVSIAGNLALAGGVLSSPQVMPVVYTGSVSNVAIPANAQAVLVQLWGPGGGGGGAIRVAAGVAASGGGGGGGGGYLAEMITIGAGGNQLAVGSTLNITVPAGGAGGGSSAVSTGNAGAVASGPTQVSFSGGGGLAAYPGGAGGAGQSGAHSGGGAGGSPGGSGGNGLAGAGGQPAAIGGAAAGGFGTTPPAAVAPQGGGGGGGGNALGLSSGAGGASMTGGAGGGAGGGVTSGGGLTAFGAGGAALPALAGAAGSGAAGAPGQFGSGGSGGAGGVSSTTGNGLAGGAGGFPGGGGGGGGATSANLAGGNAGGPGGAGLAILTWFF